MKEWLEVEGSYSRKACFRGAGWLEVATILFSLIFVRYKFMSTRFKNPKPAAL